MTYCSVCKYSTSNSKECENCIEEYDDYDINYKHFIPWHVSEKTEKEMRKEWK